MQGFEGNKTLLPLFPGQSPFEGKHPILFQILASLPPGPKALVVHHKKEEVIEATRDLHLEYYVQPVLNGTGGALLAASKFIDKARDGRLIITMGDVPFVRQSTYMRLANGLQSNHLTVLGFRPKDKRQYGVLEIEGDRVRRITEWKYWRAYPEEKQNKLQICNSGIYTVRIRDLIAYLPILSSNPHIVIKEREGSMMEIKEFFITDLVEWMNQGGLRVGFVMTEDENEVVGIDDLPSLERAQRYMKSL